MASGHDNKRQTHMEIVEQSNQGPCERSMAQFDGSLCRADNVFDVKAVVDVKFAEGEGVLAFDHNTPDNLIVAAIRYAMSLGKPFTVIPR